MTAELDLTSFRFVDSHVHHWDPANTEWYPFLSPDFDLADLGIAGAEAMRRRYQVQEYLADAAPWNMVKYVHVNATGGPKSYLGEAEWLAGLGGRLAGVIGTVDLEQDTGDVLADLKAQAEYPLFRGIRNMQIPDSRSPAFDAALGWLAEGGFVYDFLVHPSTMAEAVEAIRRHPDLDVVVEHVGWPTSTDETERALWRDGMRALADTRSVVGCKLSGIAMTAHTVTIDAVRPWFDEAIALFGLERCLAASNFPVDGAFGTYGELMRTYLAIIGGYGDAAVSAVFADNAERIYPDLMTVQLDDYAGAYRDIRFERRDGVLEMTLHSAGGPLLWNDRIHTDLGDAFYRVRLDTENRVVILTSAGEAFCPGPDPDSFHFDAGVPPVALDQHLNWGIVPGDGIHIAYPMAFGMNRGRHLALTGGSVSAQQALDWGAVAEVLPADRLRDRAWEIASDLATRPILGLRYTRELLTREIQRQMRDNLGYGLALEGFASGYGSWGATLHTVQP